MPSTKLIEGLRALSLDASPEQVETLQRYLDLLQKWNTVINLTAIRERERMIPLHVLDSLTALPWVNTGQSLLDVGSGGGLPGIPLAIMAPRVAVTLLEPNQKKAAFLRQAKMELGLENLVVEAHRVAQWKTQQVRFERIISRAFSDLAELTGASRHLIAPGGHWIAMKGALPYEELAKLPEHLRARSIPVHIPGVQAERHLILIEAAETGSTDPRVAVAASPSRMESAGCSKDLAGMGSISS